MTRSMTVTDAKTHLLALIDEVIDGEEIELLRHGRPVARLVPATGSNAMRGALSGKAVQSAADDELFSTGLTWDLP